MESHASQRLATPPRAIRARAAAAAAHACMPRASLESGARVAGVAEPLAVPCPATRSALRPAPHSRVYPPSASVADGRRCTREAAGGRGGAALAFKEVLDVDSTSHRLPSLW